MALKLIDQLPAHYQTLHLRLRPSDEGILVELRGRDLFVSQPLDLHFDAGQWQGMGRLLEGRRPESLAPWRQWVRRSWKSAPEVVKEGLAHREVLSAEQLGRWLYDGLFRGPILQHLQATLDGLDRGQGLCLAIDADPGTETGRFLHSLPWELLCTGQTRLALSAVTPVVRLLPAEHPPKAAGPGPLRVMAVVADPRDGNLTPLDVEREVEILHEIDRTTCGLQLKVVQPGTLAALHQGIREHQPHVLHFMGHGGFDGQGRGVLFFEAEDQRPDPVTGADLGINLRDRGLPLAVLNACKGGQIYTRDGFEARSAVAVELVQQQGLAGVVAMQEAITDEAAIIFSRTFYDVLATGGVPEVAISEGRLAVFNENRESLEWAVPVFFSYLGTPGEERVALPLTRVPSGDALRQSIRSWPELRAQATKDFVGRDFVFDGFEAFRQYHRHGYFLILGDPGIGKTALIAHWVTRDDPKRPLPHHFNVAGGRDNTAQGFLRNLCAQLIVRYRLDYAALPDEAGRDSAFLQRLLQEVAAGFRKGESLVVLVDALDEVAEMPKGETPQEANVLCLPEHLPLGVYFVLTARRDENLPLPSRVPLVEFELLADSHDNLADVHSFLDTTLRDEERFGAYLERHGQEREQLVETLTRLSEGNFEYLRQVLLEIGPGGKLRELTPEHLPQGLERYYQERWNRTRQQVGWDKWQSQHLPLLAALTVAREPLTPELLEVFTGLGRAEIAEFLETWRSFLRREERERQQDRYSFFHRTYGSFVRGKSPDEFLLREHEAEIGRRLLDQYYSDISAAEDPR